MTRKLLFFDIDGTLLAGGIPGYIPDSAIEALKQAQKLFSMEKLFITMILMKI